MKKGVIILLFFILTLISFATAKPQLTDKYLNHQWGVIGTEFIFKVKYLDDSGKEPAYVKIFLDNKPYDMKKISGSPATGETYQYSFVATEKEAFYHLYYFEASDGTEIVKHFDPTTADQTFGGPLILKSSLDNNKIYLFSKETNRPLWEYSIGKDWALNVDIADNAKTVVAKTSDYIYTFSKEGKLLWKYPTGLGGSNNNDPSGFAAVSDDGEKIFAGGGGQVYAFNRKSNSPVWQYKTDAGVYNIQMSDDNKYVAVGRYDDRLDLVDGNTGKILWHYDVDGGFHALGISADGNHIIGGTHCPDRGGYLFSKESNKPVWKKILNEHGSPVWCGTISSDGNYIVFGLDGSNTEQADIFLFNKNSNEPLWAYNMKNWVRSVAISADGSFIVAGTGDKRVLLFNKESNIPVWEYNAEDKVGAVDITPDGKYIAAGTKSKELLLFSKESNTPLWKFKASDWVNWVAISPDGNYIIASTGAPQYIYEGHDEKPGEQTTGGYLSKCGNGVCEPPDENEKNCCEDCCMPKTGHGESINDETEITEQDQNSFCSQFDDNRDACYSHPDECNWVMAEEVCKAKSMPQGIATVKTDDKINTNTDDNNIDEEKNFFRKIIDFFRRLFGR